MFTHILLAYDCSPLAQKAAKLVGELARQQQPQAMVRIVCAVEPISADLGEPNFSKVASERTLKGQQCVSDAAKIIGAGVDVHTEILFGPAAEEIINVAEVRHCDLIVIGLRGEGKLAGLVLGSQSQKVINHAHCPVLVVR